MSSYPDSQRELRHKIIKPDFTARCGHKFFSSSLPLKRYENYLRKCPTCKIDIYKSKMVEGVLLKAREHDKSNYEELVGFFKPFDYYLESCCDRFWMRTCKIKIDINLIKLAIYYGYDLNRDDRFNERIVQYISQIDNVHKLNCLIELGLDLKMNKGLAHSMFSWALKKGSICILDRLKELDVAPKALKKTYSFECTYKLTKWLIDNGYDLNRRIGDSYPIHLACDQMDIEVVKLMLANGADIECKDKEGYSPFHRTISRIEPFYDSDFDRMVGLQPRTLALYRFVLKIFKLGVDVESVNNENATPLYTAIKMPHKLIARHLISDWGADYKTPKIKSLDPITYILYNLYANFDSDVFINLCRTLDDIDEKNDEGKTCLHQLMPPEYDFKHVENLVTHLGANVNAQDLQGNTPLHYLDITKINNQKKLDFLLKKGADVTIKNNEGKVAFDEETIMKHA